MTVISTPCQPPPAGSDATDQSASSVVPQNQTLFVSKCRSCLPGSIMAPSLIWGALQVLTAALRRV